MISRLLIAVALLRAASSQDEDGVYRFALVSKSTQNPYFDVAGDGCLDGANIVGAREGVKINCTYTGPTADDEDINGTKQAQLISKMIDNGEIDGVSVSVRNAAEMNPVINRAVDLGIPVVTFDSDAPESKRAAYLGTDNYFFGAQIAKVVKQLQPTGGTYALITAKESPNLQERVRGFQDEMLREKGVLWEELPGSPRDIDSNITIAIHRMQEFAILEPPPTAIVPVMGAPMRSCCWRDFVNEHRLKNITLVSGDAMANQLEFLDRGYVQGLVGQLPYEMGVLSVDTLLKLKREEKIKGEIIGTNVLSHLLIPLELPPVIVDHNLIGKFSYVGYCLFALIASASIAFSVWVLGRRNLIIVKAAQPFFLIMVAAGVLVLGSSLIPLSFDDDGVANSLTEKDSSLICMSVPWLASTGFTISFSALYAKTMRVNKIFHNKSRFARVQIEPKDVALPFFGLLGMNTIILTLWTIFDPLQYQRMDLPGLDGWNRVIATYGTCRSKEVQNFLVPLAVVNITLLAAANWQAYEARYIESEFAESKYIAMAMASLLQAMMSGIPILFVVRESPQAYYLVTVFMIFIICSAVLLLIFVPKMLLAQAFIGRSEASQRRLIQESIRSQARESRNSRVSTSGVSGLANPSGQFSSVINTDSTAQRSASFQAPGAKDRESWNSSQSSNNDNRRRSSHFLECLKEDAMFEDESTEVKEVELPPMPAGNYPSTQYATEDTEPWLNESSDLQLPISGPSANHASSSLTDLEPEMAPVKRIAPQLATLSVPDPPTEYQITPGSLKKKSVSDYQETGLDSKRIESIPQPSVASTSSTSSSSSGVKAKTATDYFL